MHIRIQFRRTEICLLFFTLLLSLCVSAVGQELIVGIYDNSPKIFMDQNGDPAGIFIDLLEYTAEQEGWELEYRTGTFSALMHQLEQGQIDILPDTAYSDRRAETVHFSNVNVIDDWLQVFVPDGSDISLVRSLEGADIAVLAGSRQQQFMQHEFRDLYQIDYSIIPFPDYSMTEQAVISGIADALVASRFYYFSPERNPGVVPTSIIFAPSINVFAFPADIPSNIPERIDSHVARLQNEPGSLYYRSLETWLQTDPDSFPVGIAWLLGVALLSLIGLGIFIPLLRKQIRAGRYKLQEMDKQLQYSEHKYHEIFNATSDAIIIHDAHSGDILDMNQSALQLYGLSSQDGIRHLTDLGHADEDHPFSLAKQHIAHARRSGFHQFEWLISRKDGTRIWTEVSLKAATIGGSTRIIALIHDVSARKQNQEALQHSVMEKEVLLKELFHRTKNNMQIICSLLNMQAAEYREEIIHKAFGEAENRILAMSIVHEMLYASQSLNEIDAGEYLQNLTSRIHSRLASGTQDISIDIQTDHIPITIDSAVPLGLVLNELLSNAFFHAFPEQQESCDIRIRLTAALESEYEIKLLFCDNGIGVQDTGLLAHGGGLGLHLIRSIIRDQLNGTLSFSNSNGLCCTAAFTIPYVAIES